MATMRAKRMTTMEVIATASATFMIEIIAAIILVMVTLTIGATKMLIEAITLVFMTGIEKYITKTISDCLHGLFHHDIGKSCSYMTGV